jgi:DnaJ family protein B protein 4
LKEFPPAEASGGDHGGNRNRRQFNHRKAEEIFTEVFGKMHSVPGMKSSSFNGRPESSLNGKPNPFSGMKSSSFNNRPRAAAKDDVFSSDVFHEGTSNGLMKAPPIENKLPCTLEELYNGSIRKMKISRTVLGPGG